ncbi:MULTISPECIES: hypothetical protein [unclassified Streptomyces]|uniref:hypothetical protein n=1 Tax=unclassified Streptomyces TaxID=2593676 RepID=UPI000B00BCD5|nr:MULTISPECIES: hypothetical protein [unclassified Streptomyces]
MGQFEEHGTGYKADIDIRVGPAHSAWNCRAFAATLRADVERVLGISFQVTDDGRDPTGGYRFWFENDEMSVHVIVDDPEEGWPLDKVPATALPISRSEQVATWEIAEKLHDGLNALDTYLLIALDQFGTPVTANFDIGDDW